MNSRIKELIDQATFHKDRYALPDEFAEKFAELIVRECIGIADEYDGVGSTIVGRIEKHFGVEE